MTSGRAGRGAAASPWLGIADGAAAGARSSPRPCWSPRSPPPGSASPSRPTCRRTTRSTPSPLARLGIAAGVMALAQLARLRFRVGSGTVSVTWGEAALIIGLYLAPAGLAAGRHPGRRRARPGCCCRSSPTGVRSSRSCTSPPRLTARGRRWPSPVATALGTPIGAAAHARARRGAGPRRADLPAGHRAGSPRSPVATAPASRCATAAAARAARQAADVRRQRRSSAWSSSPSLDHDPRWLLLLPPALWLLQQTYSHRLRADDERRTWRAFADATGALNQLDERERRRRPGVRGALTLFGARAGRARRRPRRRPVAALQRRRAGGPVVDRRACRRHPVAERQPPADPAARGRRRAGRRAPGATAPVDAARRARRDVAVARSATRWPPPCTTRPPTSELRIWRAPVVVRGGPRPADQPAQPGGACSARATSRCTGSGTTTRSRCCCSTSTTSKRSTTRSGTRPATSCCR